MPLLDLPRSVLWQWDKVLASEGACLAALVGMLDAWLPVPLGSSQLLLLPDRVFEG